MKIKTKNDVYYALADFQTHIEGKEQILPAGSILSAIFIDDDLINNCKDESEKIFYSHYKGYYYVDVIDNGICDYVNFYLIDHELDRFIFEPNEVEVISE